ncbi:MAG: PAS domain-containing sensor histidine kinase, partial [Candidatus Hodarchaeales archaeon]
ADEARRLSEEKLRISEAKFRALAEQSLVGITIVQNEQVIYANPAAGKISGYSSEEVLSWGEAEFMKAIHPEDRERFLSLTKTDPQGERDLRLRFDSRIITKSGDVRWLAAHSATINLANGSASCWSFTDITTRKEAEEALRESQEKFQQLFRDSPISLWEEDFREVGNYFDQLRAQGIVDFRDYFDSHPQDVAKLAALVKIIDVNNSTLQLYGATSLQDFLDGLPYFFDEESLIAFKEGLIALAEGKTVFESETINYTLQGERLNILLKLTVVPGYEELLSRIIVSIINITDLKQAEEELRESDERWRTLFHNANDAILVFGFTENGKPSFFTEVNDVACRKLGYLREELLTLSIKDLYSSEESAKIPKIMHELLTKGQIIFEINQTAKNGCQIPVEVSSHLFQMKNDKVVLSIVRDITERKQAENAYQSMIESMLQGITIFQNGRFVFANRAMEEIMGHTNEELMALSPEEVRALVHPDDQQHLAKRQQSWLEGKPVTPRYSHRLIRKDGTICWLEGFTSRVDFQGKPAIQQTAIDITERKQAQELLRQQKKELSEFAHAMSHDLKNSLLSIQGYAEVVEREHDRTYAKKIGQLATRMNALLHRSLLLADAGQVIEMTEEVNLTQLIQAVAESVVPKSVRFILEDLPKVMGDPEKLSQVFQNLFENAVTHGNPTTIEVRHRDANDGTQILICNDGNLIPPEHQPKVFQQRFSTKKDGEGLGLAIVQKLVQAHSWQISLVNAPTTTFCISLPAEN